MISKTGQFDIKRKKVRNQRTLTFMDDIKKLDSFGVGMTKEMLAKLLCVSISSLHRWEREQLIFPQRVGKAKARKYRYKDILRAFTIKYLMAEMGYRRFVGVRLLLEMTNQAITSRDEPIGTINNYRIDKYLMKILNYDVETTALTKLENSIKKKEEIDDCSK